MVGVVGDADLALHNGAPLEKPVVPLSDPMVSRGDGCFEALRSYDGAMFGLDEHLERLRLSAERLHIELPSLGDIAAWAKRVAMDRGDGVVRIFASSDSGAPNVYVFSTSLPEIPDHYRLMPVEAPWHPAGAEWQLAGVKTLSYAPNMAATRTARRAGYHDALLIGRDGTLLEAPTAGVFWVREGVLETAGQELGVLASVTMRFALEQARAEGIDVRPGRYPRSYLDEASEVAILSTTREIRPVVAVGDLAFEPGPVTTRLADAYERKVAELKRLQARDGNSPLADGR